MSSSVKVRGPRACEVHVSAAAILVAGLAAGIAEMAWILTFDAAGVVSASAVASEVFATIARSRLPATGLGVLIHLLLSVGLAFVIAPLIWLSIRRRLGAPAAWASCIGALAGVWAINFLIVLPAWNPVFVRLMPWAVALGSKVVFGAVLAWVLEWRASTVRISRTVPRLSTTN